MRSLERQSGDKAYFMMANAFKEELEKRKVLEPINEDEEKLPGFFKKAFQLFEKEYMPADSELKTLWDSARKNIVDMEDRSLVKRHRRVKEVCEDMLRVMMKQACVDHGVTEDSPLGKSLMALTCNSSGDAAEIIKCHELAVDKELLSEHFRKRTALIRACSYANSSSQDYDD